MAESKKIVLATGYAMVEHAMTNVVQVIYTMTTYHCTNCCDTDNAYVH